MTDIGLFLSHLPMERSEVRREREAIGILLGHFPMLGSEQKMEWPLVASGLATCFWTDQKWGGRGKLLAFCLVICP